MEPALLVERGHERCERLETLRQLFGEPFPHLRWLSSDFAAECRERTTRRITTVPGQIRIETGAHSLVRRRPRCHIDEHLARRHHTRSASLGGRIVLRADAPAES